MPSLIAKIYLFDSCKFKKKTVMKKLMTKEIVNFELLCWF